MDIQVPGLISALQDLRYIENVAGSIWGASSSIYFGFLTLSAAVVYGSGRIADAIDGSSKSDESDGGDEEK